MRKLFVLAVAAAALFSGAAGAQGYPSRPVKLVLGFPAGGPTDLMVRLLADQLQNHWKNPVIVENRPGGGTFIAADAVARSEPDGYTLYASTPAMHAFRLIIKGNTFEPFKEFAPVAGVYYNSGMIVISPTLPVNSYKEFVDYAKANAGKLNYGSHGRSGTMYATELFKTETGIQMTEVPFQGGAQIVPAMQRGDVHFYFNSTGGATPQVAAGTMKPLAVDGDQREPNFPDVPTLKELGHPDVKLGGTMGLVAPKATPKEIIDAIGKAVVASMGVPEAQEKLSKMGSGQYVAAKTAEQYLPVMQEEARVQEKQVKAAKLKPQ
jgi:tripartite-type tricarboxylate transporter receptor subunit TctC